MVARWVIDQISDLATNGMGVRVQHANQDAISMHTRTVISDLGIASLMEPSVHTHAYMYIRTTK